VKLNWFSPVPPTQSAIAFDTPTLITALARKVDVTVWVHEEIWAEGLENHATVKRYDPSDIPWTEINAADATIYHIGNHAEYHGPIWEVSRRHPGIIVLHDLSLQHFFAGLAMRNLALKHAEYCDMMAFYHAAEARDAAMAVLAGKRSAADICDYYPLTAAALENATGVAAHNERACSLLRGLTAAPVAYVPLAARNDYAALMSESGDATDRTSDGIFRIVMFGFLGPNRRVKSVLHALKDYPHRDRFHLHIYGTLSDEKGVLRMVREFALEAFVTVYGYVDADELRKGLSLSDLAINLRDPTMGEASSTQLQIWQHGLPSLVTDIGWYATLPRNTVATVQRESEREDIRAHLDNFLSYPETYRELGRNGHRYVEEHHSSEKTIAALLALVERTLADKSAHAVSWMAGRAGSTIRPWFDDGAAGVFVPRLAQTISQVFDVPSKRL